MKPTAIAGISLGVVLTALAAGTAKSAVSPSDPVTQDSVVAFRGAAIETVSPTGRIENGTILIRGGKIEAVGRDVAIPESARVINATGKTIMPGIIDLYSVVNVPGDAAPTETRTVTFGGRTLTIPNRGSITSSSFTRIADVFYPYGTTYRVPARSGITHVNFVARGLGQAAIARITPQRPESMLIHRDGILFASVTNQSSSLDVLRMGLASAARSGAASEPTPTGAPRPLGVPPGSGASPGQFPASAPSDPRELWQQVYEGKAPLLVNVNNSATILHLLKLIEPYKDVRVLVVSTGGNVFQTLGKLKDRKVSLVLRPAIEFVPNTRDRVNVVELAHSAGVDFALSLSLDAGDLAASQDTPLFAVAYLVKAGLPRQAALAALTIRPATLLGLEKSHGSLEVGKQANLLVFDADPLDPVSQLRQVYVEGGLVYEN